MDVNEPPEFEGLYVRFDVEENTPALTDVGESVMAVDPELDDLTYSLNGVDADLFEFDPSTGLLRVGPATALDFEDPADSNGDNVYELVVQVSDGTDEAGEEDGDIDDEIGVIVSVTNVREPGEAVSSTVQLAILENTPVNTEVGPPIRADAAEGVGLSFSLAGLDAASFDIDPSSGQMSTRVEFDFEIPADANGDNIHELVVQVTDGEDSEGNADPSVDHEIGVAIRVLDVNESPEVLGLIGDRTLIESEGIDRFDVSTYFRDPDGGELVFSAASSDPRVASVGIAGATLVIAPTGIGTATIEVTAIDPGQQRNRHSFRVNVVSERVGAGGFFPIFPPVHQGSGGAAGAGTDPANLLSESEVIVVPRAMSLQPGQAARVHAIAFNLLGDAIPGGMAGIACTWSSDGGGKFIPNGTGTACTTTFTAPQFGSGTIVVRVTQGTTLAVGLAAFEVSATETKTAKMEREAIPRIEFPADVTGSVVWRGEGAFITSPGGLTMEVPAGAIGSDFLGVFIREVSTADLVLPGHPGFAVGSHAGDFSFTDDDGDPMPGFRTRAPVRICLPFTEEDIDKAVGGADGVHVVHVAADGGFVRHPSDSEFARMMTCAVVDDFSVYFVGIAMEATDPTADPTPTFSPTPAQRATAVPTPEPTATSIPVPKPTPGLTPEPIPLLPVAGDRAPGPRALFLLTLSAVAAIAIGVVLLRRIRPVKPSR